MEKSETAWSHRTMRGLLFSTLCLFFLAASMEAADPLYEIDLTVAGQGFDGKSCWVHARAGVIPAGTAENPAESPLAVMTLQRLQLSGSDVFYALNEQ